MTDIDKELAKLAAEHQAEAEWARVLTAKVGEILVDRMEGDVRFIIMRSHLTLCAYIGVPDTHPLAGLHYDHVQDIEVHGGFTYAGQLTYHPEGFWFFGWDYAHIGDYAAIAEAHPDVPFLTSPPGHKWTVLDVEKDSAQAILDFRFFARERGA